MFKILFCWLSCVSKVFYFDFAIFSISTIYFISRAFIPGKIFPSRSSKKAPPAVDIYVKSSVHPNIFIAEAVSQPPATEISDLFLVFSLIFFAILLVPSENSFSSK